VNLWYARYTGDYHRKTAHLSLTQHGAYSLLLDHYYSMGRPLPTEIDALYRICKAMSAAERAAVDSVLKEFFELREDGYHNKRGDKELGRREEKRKQQSDAGRKGAEAAHGNDGQRHDSGGGERHVLEGGERQDSEPGERQEPVVARPQPQSQIQPKPETQPENTHTAPSAQRVSADLAGFWNDHRGPMPQLLKLTKARAAKVCARIQADPSFPEIFRRAVLKARLTPFCCGSGDRGWKANFDWLVVNDTNCIAVLEGKYDGGKGATADERTSENIRVAGAYAN
jgi:uncharacterized protein YdaU (DUF1376 family)